MVALKPSRMTAQEFLELSLNDPEAARAASKSVLRGHEAADVRAAAANLLGSAGGRDALAAVPALTRAASDPSAAVRRRAAQWLGRLGDDVDILQRLAADKDSVVRRTAEAALTFMGYRLGEPIRLVPADAADVALEVPRGAAMRKVDFGADQVKRARRVDAERDLPTVEFADTEVLAFRCGKQEVSVLATAALAPRTEPFNTLTRPRILAALVRHDVCSDGGEIAAYVLSDDRDGTGGREPRLWVIRGNGTVLHGGRGVADSTGIAFTLDRSNPPYSPPVLVEGRLDLASMKVTAKGRVGALPKGRRGSVPTTVVGPPEPVGSGSASLGRKAAR